MTGFSKTVLLIAKLALSASLIVWLISYASPSNIAAAIGDADLPLLITVVPLVLIGALVAASQLKVLTDCHGMGISLRRILAINFSIEFYNLFLPGYISGGAIRWYKLSRDNRMRAQAFAAIVLNRLCNTIMMLVWALGGWLVDTTAQRSHYVGIFVVGLLAALIAGSLVALRPETERLLRNRVMAHPSVKPWLRDKLNKLISAAGEFRLISASDRLALLAYSSLTTLISAVGIFVFLLALGLSIPFVSVLWMQALVGLAILLPVTISGFGIREGSWIYLLGLYGVAPADAFVLSMLTFLRQLLKGTIGLFIELRTFLVAR